MSHFPLIRGAVAGAVLVVAATSAAAADPAPSIVADYRLARGDVAGSPFSVLDEGRLGSDDGGHVTPDGRAVLIATKAPLAPANPANVDEDLFLVDVASHTAKLVSANAGGVGGNQFSLWGALSGDGRYAVFDSAATNLVPQATKAFTSIYRKDLATGSILRVSVSNAGAAGDATSGMPSISRDGSRIAFESFATNLVKPAPAVTAQIYLRDVTAGRTRLVSTTAGGISGDGYSARPQIRADGSAVVFASHSTNLVAPDANGEHWDIFHKDLATGALTRVSQDATGVQFPGDSVLPALSRDGGKVAFTVGEDSSFVRQVHVKDLATGALTLVSADAAGTAGSGDSFSPSFSPSGRLVMFLSDATDLVEGCGGNRDVFVKDLASGAIWCLTRPDGTPMFRRFGAVFEAEFTPGGRGFAISTTAQLSSRDKVKNVADVYVGRFTAAFVAQAKP